MASLYTHKEANIRKTFLLFAVFLVVIIGIGWFFSRVYANPGILFFAVIFSSLMSFISYWYSDKIVLKISKAEPVKKENYRELYNIVENLCITAGLPVPRIYLINDDALNAFATGRDPKHAMVAVTSGLLEKLDRSEMEGVIAHELSHIGNRDILLSTVAVVLAGFAALLSDFFLRSMFWGGMRRNNSDRGQAGGIMMIIGIALAILAPIATALIQLAISRNREFLADSSGALLTRYPEGLAKALEKISKDPRPLRAVNKATAHLYIANPFKGKKFSTLFMTHPPIEERVRRLCEMNL